MRAYSALALLLLFTDCALPGVAAAAPMRFERLGLDDGLSQQTVQAIAQDTSGFMWFGTEDGLDRYDGYTFKHLRHTQANTSGLASDFVTDVQFDASGRLWIATAGGSVVWRDSAEQAFHSVVDGVTEVAARGLHHVQVIRFDRSGRLWIGTRAGGLAIFEPARGKLLRLRHKATDPGSLGDDCVNTLLEDRHGGIWVGTQSGLDRLDPATGRFQHILLDPGKVAHVHALLEDQRGMLWIGTDDGLLQLNPHTGVQLLFHHDAADPHSLPSDQVSALYRDSRERLWIGTADGLALLDRDSGAFDIQRNDPADASSLPDNHILTLREDRTGLLWVGTRFGGAAHWNPRTWSFGQHAGGAADGMASRNVNAFTEDRKGRLWIATFGGGITIITPTTKPANGPLADPLVVRPVTLRHDARKPRGLSDDRVMALLTDHEGSVWAGTLGGGLDRIDPRTLAVTVFAHNPDDLHTLGAPGVVALLEDAGGVLWAATLDGGLSRFERATGRFERYVAEPRNPDSLSADRVTALAADRTGRLWVGTDGGGLNILDPASGRFFQLPHDPRKPRSLSSATVCSLYVDAKGTVWVGTRGGGLDRVVGSALAPEAIRFDNFTDRNGLPNDTIYGIQADLQGRLWLSTNHGLARFDPQSGQVRSFHRSHGLQEEEFNFGAHYASPTGKLFFGGASGYNGFDPTRVVFDDVPPPVVLTTVLELNKPIPLTPGFRLPNLHYRDVVTFEFAALDFAAPRANSFAFKLEGFDREWESAADRRSVTYTNLPDGHYTLRTRAANPDGVWNKEGLALPFDVDPAPWASRSAYLGYLLLVAALIAISWDAHRRSLVREARYSHRLEEEVVNRTSELATRNSELEIANRRLEQASLTDPLTGLGNRRSLIKDMPRLIAAAQLDVRHLREVPQRMTLLLVDLDRLKPINDQYGHEAGDQALAAVATLLRRCLRDTDRVVRWGGDEFVIVRTPSDLDDAAALAEAICTNIAELQFRVSEFCTAHTTCSIGFACYPFVAEAPRAATWEEVLNLADMALYRAKARRDAWLGWSGLPKGARQTELFNLLAVDPAAAVRGGYIDVRSSPGLGGELTEMPARRTQDG